MLNPIWKCRDGRQMPVSQMDDQHLANSIAKIQRDWPRFRPEWLERLKLEVELRKRMKL